jgi:hypothetical protein
VIDPNDQILLSSAIPKLRARSVETEKFVLDMNREIAHPPFDPDEVLVCGHGSVDQHHRRRRFAILVDEPPPEIEQHNGEVLVDDTRSSEPINPRLVGGGPSRPFARGPDPLG